ncbi:response regulator [Sulfuriferula thiophila]|uniref:response regulator n=1 Tax=Sulfuriferula thiophila TaxID=1781211 RepID=UPI000F611299|nr:response regulator [Sulfuriferula thiophila]
MRVLIVEDDDLLAAGLVRALDQTGYAVDRVNSGERADLALSSETYDLVVLDIGLPGIDGFSVLKRLRTRGQTCPVLILTARDAVTDRVRGLDLGADDYMVKPFALSEFEARLRALVRRGVQLNSAQLVCGNLILDTLAHRAWLNQAPLNLTAREWGVLEYLLMRQGQVLSKDKILQAVCSWDETISPNAIEVYMSRLRNKLEPAGVNIRTIRGFGYLLEADDTTQHASA